MPLSAYFGGKGPKVMEKMQGKYGAKHGREVFYAMLMKRKGSSSKNPKHEGLRPPLGKHEGLRPSLRKKKKKQGKRKHVPSKRS